MSQIEKLAISLMMLLFLPLFIIALGVYMLNLIIDDFFNRPKN